MSSEVPLKSIPSNQQSKQLVYAISMEAPDRGTSVASTMCKERGISIRKLLYLRKFSSKPSIDDLIHYMMCNIINKKGLNILENNKAQNIKDRYESALAFMELSTLKEIKPLNWIERRLYGLAPSQQQSTITSDSYHYEFDDLNNVEPKATSKTSLTSSDISLTNLFKLDDDHEVKDSSSFYGSPTIKGLNLITASQNISLDDSKYTEDEFDVENVNAMRLSASVMNLSSHEKESNDTPSLASRIYGFYSSIVKTETPPVQHHDDAEDSKVYMRLRPRRKSTRNKTHRK